MLSRVAESLYWMARNVERAEDLARLIDVTAMRAVDHADDAGARWLSAYNIAGIDPPEDHGLSARSTALESIVFDADSRRSVAACGWTRRRLDVLAQHPRYRASLRRAVRRDARARRCVGVPADRPLDRARAHDLARVA
jgi:uncharacterized alpha-E superfamily protein